MFRTVSWVSLLIWAVIAADASALGLGGLRTESALNQPYVGEIDLFDASPDELDTVKATLASADDFAKSGLERYHFLTKLAFQPMLSPRGGTVIRVTSEEPIREPFVDFLVEVQWPEGRLVKGYMVLLDPPEVRDRRAARGGSPASADPRPVERPASRPSRQTPVQSSPPSAAPEAVTQPASQVAPASAVPRVPVGSDGFPITFGPVRAGQGLLTLASSAVPRDATADQTAMALYRNNQDAFVNGDINRLTVGKSLVIPTQAELFALDAAAAQRELRAALQGAPVRRTPITDVTRREAPEPEPAPPAQGGPPRIAGTAGPDVSQVPADGSVPGSGQEQPQDLAGALQPGPLLDIDAIARADQQIGDLQERILQLETELEDKQGVLEQRDTELVLLGQMTSPASAVPEALVAGSTTAADSAPDPNDTTLGAGVAEGPADGSGESAAPALGADPEAGDVTGPVLAGPSDQDSGTTVEVAGQPAKSTWHAYLLPLAGFAAATALGVVVFSLVSARRRREEQDAEEEFEVFDSVNLDEFESAPAPSDTDAHQVAQAKSSENTKTFGETNLFQDTEDFGLAGTAGAATDSDLLVPSSMMDSLDHFDTETDEADALSEADIYIAYGRYSEAEELLKREVKRAPERYDVRLKLAEVYAGADKVEAMQELMKALMTSGADVAEPELWQHLVEVAQAAEQRGAREPGASVSKTVSSGVPGGETGLNPDRAGAGFALSAADDGEEDSFSLDLDEDLNKDQEIAPLLRSDARPADPAFDVAFEPALRPAPSTARRPAPDSEGLDSDVPAAEDVDDDLPLLFDESALDEPLVLNQDSEPRGDALGKDSNSGSDLVLTLDDLRDSTEMDLDAFLKTPSPFGLSSESEGTAALPDLDLPSDFDLPAALGRSQQQSPTQESTLPTLDLDDFEIPDNPVELADDSPAAQWPMDADIWDDNATKLDLARAYINMDDSTAACEILEEVISAGRDEQRIEAEALLRALT